MTTTVKQMLEAANAAVPRITLADAQAMIAKGDVLVVDVRDAPEVEASGKVAGAKNVSRGMIEFRADPSVPYHDPAFTKDKSSSSWSRWTFRPQWQGSQGHGLHPGLQHGRVQGLGRGRRCDRKSLSRPDPVHDAFDARSRVFQRARGGLQD